LSHKRAAQTDRWSPPLATVAVFVLTVAVCGLRLSSPGLVEPDEARYAAVGQAMWASGDFVTPRLNGFAYLDKPPLLHWLTALSIGLFGPHEFAVRLSSLLAAAAGVALTYAFGRHVFGHHAGIAAAAVLATSVLWFAVGRVIRYDMLLTLAVTATIWWAWLGSEGGREGTGAMNGAPTRSGAMNRAPTYGGGDGGGRDRAPTYGGGDGGGRDRAARYGGGGRGYYCLAAAAAGLGVLVKGPIALVLPVFVMVPYLGLTRRLSALLQVPWLAVLGILAVIIVPWFALCEHANPGAIRFFLLHENVARVTGEIDAAHQQAWWYLGPVLLGACWPWTLFLPGAVTDGFGGRRHGEEPQRRACILWLVWVAVPLVLFSLSKVKVETYILPCLPPIALLIGRYVSPARKRGLWAAVGTGILLIGVAAAVVFVKLGQSLPVAVKPVALIWALAGLEVIAAAILRARKWAVALLAISLLASYHVLLWSAGRDPRFPSDKALAQKVAELRKPGERIFSIRQLSRGTVFYLDDRVAVFGNAPAEYEFPGNAGRLRGRVYRMEDAESVLTPGPTAVIICRRRFWPEFEAAAHGMVTTIGQTDRALILRSEPRPARDVRAGEPPP